MATWGSDDAFLFNFAFSKLLGPNHEEGLGRPFCEVMAPEWASISGHFVPARNGSATIAHDVPLRTWRSNFKELRYYTYAYTPIRDDQGAVCGVTCICSDTTETVEAQRQIRLERDLLGCWFEDAPGFLAMSDGADHIVTMANKEFRRLIADRQVIGFKAFEALPELVPQGYQKVLDDVFASGKPFVGKELGISLEDNKGGHAAYFIDVVYAPRRDPAGNIVGLICQGYDVTDHVGRGERLKALQSELIYLSRASAMDAMAATLAHELNQPLTAISNFAAASQQLLLASAYDRLGTPLQAIRESALRAGAIIKNVRNMTKKGSVPNSIVDFGEVMEGAFQMMPAASMQKVKCDIEAPALVLGDKIQLQQVVMNLVKNALEAIDTIPDGTVRICVTHEGGKVLVKVIDNGSGIDPERADTIFNSFVTTKKSGTGLGLSICRAIVEAHNGRIWATNVPTGGASISFTIPHCEIDERSF
nr:PAS domain-containing sensor histidine kinase [Sphingomonas xinjiangensis]